MKNSFYFLLFILTAILACNRPTESGEVPTDTPTSGEVHICIDESYQLLMDAEIYAFEATYDRAKVHAHYISEKDGIKLLLDDSCKVAILSRPLSKEEKALFETNNIYPKETKLAEDAVAIIVHPENVDSSFTVGQIKDILKGVFSSWSQINPENKLEKLNVVFDNQGSANARYMKDSLLNGEEFGENVFAAHSNQEVIEYVNQHKGALGLISVNWISDKDDSLVRDNLSKIKVARIKRDSSSKAFTPHQAYIKSKEYPFCRDVFAINRQTRAGLGMGFVSYLAGNNGQLIILKAGMVPSIAPVRMVKLTTN